MSFFAEVKRRNVIRVAGLYLVAAWLITQVSATLLPAFEAPPWVLRAIVMLLAIGFVPTLIFSWIYELTPEGIKRDADVPLEQSIGHVTARRIDFAIIAVLLLALVYFAIDKFVLAPQRGAPPTVVATSDQKHLDAASAVAAAPAAASAIPEKSIAVLPFDNLSDDKSNAYFAEGMQDEILTRLAKVGALKVISRTSTMQYAGKPGNLSEIARQLGVMNIVEGSVQKAANRVRINVQLIRADGDKHLWAETYDRTLDDIFGVQGEVAGAIADKLGATLSSGARAEVTAVPTRNAAAYDAYLRGVALFREGSDNSTFIASTRAFEEAVKADPDFALAWALLARNGAILIFFGGDATAARREATLHALETAERLQPDALETQAARAYYVYRVQRDYDDARRRFEELHRRWPNDAEILETLSYVLSRQGRLPEAMARLDDAILLDPLNLRLHKFRALEAICDRRFDDALKVLARVQSIAPEHAVARHLEGQVYLAQGDLARAAPLLNHPPKNVSEDEGAYVALARQQRDYAPAIAALQELLQRPGADDAVVDTIGTRLDLADLQRLAGDRAGALGDYREVRSALLAQLEGQPDNTSLLLELAAAEAGLGNETAALSAIDRAIQLVPESRDTMAGPTYLESRARLLARFGHKDESIAMLQHLLAVPYIGVTALGALTPADLRLDPDFDKLRDDARFQALANPGGIAAKEGDAHG